MSVLKGKEARVKRRQSADSSDIAPGGWMDTMVKIKDDVLAAGKHLFNGRQNGDNGLVEVPDVVPVVHWTERPLKVEHRCNLETIEMLRVITACILYQERKAKAHCKWNRKSFRGWGKDYDGKFRPFRRGFVKKTVPGPTALCGSTLITTKKAVPVFDPGRFSPRWQGFRIDPKFHQWLQYYRRPVVTRHRTATLYGDCY